MEFVKVSLPVGDAPDLELLTSIEGSRVSESRPFDGVAAAQVLVPITVVSVPIIKAWITQRFEHKKAQVVTLGGMRFTGYSAKEVERLAQLLEERGATSDQPDASPNGE